MHHVYYRLHRQSFIRAETPYTFSNHPSTRSHGFNACPGHPLPAPHPAARLVSLDLVQIS